MANELIYQSSDEDVDLFSDSEESSLFGSDPEELFASSESESEETIGPPAEDRWSHGFIIRYSYNSRAGLRGNDIDAIRVKSIKAKQGIEDVFTPNDWEKIGQAIGQFTALEVIDFSKCGNLHVLRDNYITSLFGGSRASNFPMLRELNLSHNNVGCVGMTRLLPFLKSRTKPFSLILNSTGLNNEGAIKMSDVLGSVRIELLSLNGIETGGDGVGRLFSAQNAKYLKALDLDNNSGIGTDGLHAISQFLRRGDTNIERLFVSPMGADDARMLVNSISSNSKLECVSFWEDDYEKLLELSPSIENLVCKTTSFESLCASNHTLRWLGNYTRMFLREANSAILEALDINARSECGVTNVKRMRCKLRMLYFNKPHIDVQSFAKMDVTLMPFVLELIAKTEIRIEALSVAYLGKSTYFEIGSTNLNGIYQLVRNCHMPELFSFPSSEYLLDQMNAKNKQLEAENATQKQEINKLTAQIKELQAQLSGPLKNKRPKTHG